MRTSSSIARTAPGSMRDTEEKSRTASLSVPSKFLASLPQRCDQPRFIDIQKHSSHCHNASPFSRPLMLDDAGHLPRTSSFISLPEQFDQFRHERHARVRPPGRIVKRNAGQFGHRAFRIPLSKFPSSAIDFGNPNWSSSCSVACDQVLYFLVHRMAAQARADPRPSRTSCAPYIPCV